MKFIFYMLVLSLITSVCHAGEEWESDYPLIAGEYEVIGKRMETGKLFSGSITIKEEKPNVFVVVRVIDGKKITGSGNIELSGSEKTPIFRMRFVENGTAFEGTFLWQSDLDNYGRISGYVYTKDYQGKTPGLESLFAKRE